MPGIDKIYLMNFSGEDIGLDWSFQLQILPPGGQLETFSYVTIPPDIIWFEGMGKWSFDKAAIGMPAASNVTAHVDLWKLTDGGDLEALQNYITNPFLSGEFLPSGGEVETSTVWTISTNFGDPEADWGIWFQGIQKSGIQDELDTDKETIEIDLLDIKRAIYEKVRIHEDIGRKVLEEATGSLIRFIAVEYCLENVPNNDGTGGLHTYARVTYFQKIGGSSPLNPSLALFFPLTEVMRCIGLAAQDYEYAYTRQAVDLHCSVTGLYETVNFFRRNYSGNGVLGTVLDVSELYLCCFSNRVGTDIITVPYSTDPADYLSGLLSTDGQSWTADYKNSAWDLLGDLVKGSFGKGVAGSGATSRAIVSLPLFDTTDGEAATGIASASIAGAIVKQRAECVRMVTSDCKGLSSEEFFPTATAEDARSRNELEFTFTLPLSNLPSTKAAVGESAIAAITSVLTYLPGMDVHGIYYLDTPAGFEAFAPYDPVPVKVHPYVEIVVSASETISPDTARYTTPTVISAASVPDRVRTTAEVEQSITCMHNIFSAVYLDLFRKNTQARIECVASISADLLPQSIGQIYTINPNDLITPATYLSHLGTTAALIEAEPDDKGRIKAVFAIRG